MAAWTVLVLGGAACAHTVEVTVDVDATSVPKPFPHYWKKSFGSGHAKLTVRSDWQQHLKRAVDELGLRGVRYHGLFDDDMGPIVTPGSSPNEFKYNWTKADKAWDYQLSVGVTPIVELSFMPAYLAGCTWAPPDSHGKPVNPGHPKCQGTMAYHGITQTPQNYESWYKLVKNLAEHLVERYGLAEIKTWHFEVWNELWGMPFPTEYMKLFNASSRALKSVEPSLLVGGPATAQLKNVIDFITEATRNDIPFDFVSTHMYPTDPQCGRGQDWSADCLTNGVKNLRDQVASISPGLPFYLTEYNVGCCLGYPQHDTSGAAAFIYRQIGALDGVTDVLSWWTFSDVFEEGGLPDTEFKDIYGLMTIHGVPKPGWRAFQLLHSYAGNHRVKASVSDKSTQWLKHEEADETCTTENATDMIGFDILPDTSHLILPTFDACCEACHNHSKPVPCAFWSYNTKESRCYLKTSDAGRTHDAKFVSGSSSGPTPPNKSSNLISALATLNVSGVDDDNVSTVAVYLGYWLNGGSDVANRTVTVNLKHAYSLFGEKGKAITAIHYVIDQSHANPLEAWKLMGSPKQPSEEQLEKLIEASQVKPEPLAITHSNQDDETMQQSVVIHMESNSAVLLLFSSS